jgi:hypothetical protein
MLSSTRRGSKTFSFKLAACRALDAVFGDKPMQILVALFLIRMNSSSKKYLANLGQTSALLPRDLQ